MPKTSVSTKIIAASAISLAILTGYYIYLKQTDQTNNDKENYKEKLADMLFDANHVALLHGPPLSKADEDKLWLRFNMT